MNRKILFTGLILLSIIIIFNGCKQQSDPIETKKAELGKLKGQLVELQGKITNLEKDIAASGKNGTNGNSVHVQIADVKPETFRRYLDLQGVVESMKAVSISAKTPGQVLKVFSYQGASVNKGDMILQIDDAVMQKSLIELQTGLDFATTMYEKQKRLWEQKAVSEVQYLTAKNAKEQLERRIETTKEQIDFSRVQAPFSGFIDQIVPKEGETVSPGMPIVKLTTMSEVKVTAEVSESYISTFKVGQQVTVSFPELNENVEAKINVVSRAIDTRNRTFKIEVKLPKVPEHLRPNMVCSVSINDITKDNVLLAPLAVVQRQGDKEFLFVTDETGTKAVKRFVQTGLTYKDKTEIIAGLKVGDKIITSGAYDVSEGQAVNIEK